MIRQLTFYFCLADDKVIDCETAMFSVSDCHVIVRDLGLLATLIYDDADGDREMNRPSLFGVYVTVYHYVTEDDHAKVCYSMSLRHVTLDVHVAVYRDHVMLSGDHVIPYHVASLLSFVSV